MFFFAFIAGPPTAERKNSQEIARLGEDFRLTCPISAYASAGTLFVWKKDSETIDRYTWDRFTPSKKSLKIKEVASEDSGVYVCKGINGFGSEEVQIKLIVIGKKAITMVNI